MEKEKIIVTGCAGFIGMHVVKSLLMEGYHILGIDSLNDYYSVQLKKDRLKRLDRFKNFTFEQYDISDLKKLKLSYEKFNPNKVINLAAQAGVRYSLINPHEYIKSNINGFLNVLECCKLYKVKKLVYASSSSVYGGINKNIFSENDKLDKPISIYAVSKISNELMARSYNHLYGIKMVGLRFFTVYGPWGRPDMAMYIFANKILNKEPVPVFNNGDMYRDFTYIDDIIEGIRASLSLDFNCETFNLGNNNSESIMYLLSLIENTLNKKAIIDFQKIQPGDVKKTVANIEYAEKLLNYQPKTKLQDGVSAFLDWYLRYHKVKI